MNFFAGGFRQEDWRIASNSNSSYFLRFFIPGLVLDHSTTEDHLGRKIPPNGCLPSGKGNYTFNKVKIYFIWLKLFLELLKANSAEEGNSKRVPTAMVGSKEPLDLKQTQVISEVGNQESPLMKWSISH